MKKNITEESHATTFRDESFTGVTRSNKTTEYFPGNTVINSNFSSLKGKRLVKAVY